MKTLEWYWQTVEKEIESTREAFYCGCATVFELMEQLNTLAENYPERAEAHWRVLRVELENELMSMGVAPLETVVVQVAQQAIVETPAPSLSDLMDDDDDDFEFGPGWNDETGPSDIEG